jgi:acyl-coenzyme A thioesterase PaaI-like protein
MTVNRSRTYIWDDPAGLREAGSAMSGLEFMTKVNFVRPITPESGRVRCEGTILYRGRRVATAEGRLIAESTGKLLAHGTTTCMVMRS